MGDFFNTLFGSKKKVTNINYNDITINIQKINETMETLDKKITYNERKIAKFITNAKEYNKNKNKQKAISCLRQKKNLEKMNENLDKQRSNLEYQLYQMESLSMNSQVVSTMKGVNTVIKNFEKDVNIDKVDDLHDDLQESIQSAVDITNAISQPLNPNIDDDELSAELDEMDQEELNEQLLNVDNAELILPEVPKTKLETPVAETKKHDDDLRELELLLT